MATENTNTATTTETPAAEKVVQKKYNLGISDEMNDQLQTISGVRDISRAEAMRQAIAYYAAAVAAGTVA